MKNNLGVSLNFFSSSKNTKKLKDKFIPGDTDIQKSKLSIHMSLMQLKRGGRRKKVLTESRKKTNKFLRLYKRGKDIIYFNKLKKEIKKKIFSKYANPYIENIHYKLTPFSKEKKILYYDYYQICHILDQKKYGLFIKYKEFKLIYDNQDLFLKFFSIEESRVYLTYLLYVTYAKDPFVKSNRLVCLNKDIKKVKQDYNNIIVKNVFEAKRMIFSRDLNKYYPNISPKLYEMKQKKLTKIAIPKYKLLIKPVISKINYIYIKDVPYQSIPKIIPNYFPNDKKINVLINNYILKKKFSLLLINGKRVPKGRKALKNTSKEISKNNINILNSIRTTDSEEGDMNTNPDLFYISRFNDYHNINKENKNIRFKHLNEINDIEEFVGKINKLEKKNKEKKEESGDDVLKSNLESLNTVYEKDENDVFLSSLKKPFIGNRDQKIKKIKIDSNKNINMTGNENNDENIIMKLNKINLIEDKNRKKKFKLFLDLGEDEYNLKENNSDYNNNFGKNIINSNTRNTSNNNVVKEYFRERFINPKKYKEYILKSPFIETLIKFHNSFQLNDNSNIKYINTPKILSNKKNYSYSFDKNKNNKNFKDTYKFILEFNKKEKREEIIKNILDKSNKILTHMNTMAQAEKKHSNFKKSGPFAFTSYKGSNFDKIKNEWEDMDNYFKARYNKNSFTNTFLLRKINNDYERKENYLNSCTTSNQILKSTNIYL